jgi:hypothetical protein
MDFMRSLTKYLLILNACVLAFIVLWLLVGGSRSYYGGGAAAEVDGIALLFLALFNVAYLATVFVTLPGAGQTAAAAKEVLTTDVARGDESWRTLVRGWSQWALLINGALILFIGLWLLLKTGRWTYFQSNATEVDLILLLMLSLLNLAHMRLMFLRLPRPTSSSGKG